MNSVRLNLNENPRVSPAILSALQNIEPNRYPDTSAASVRAALADLHRLQPDQFFVSAGSDAAMVHLAQTLLRPGESAVVPRPAYPGFLDAVAATHGTVLSWHLTDKFEYDLSRLPPLLAAGPRLVIVCHPHNPCTSTLTPLQLDQICRLCEQAGALLVVDEAYAEYAEGTSFCSGLDLLLRGRQLVVTRTFSKFYGLAGLRIGYVATSARLALRLEQASRPFRVNQCAQAAALAALDDESFQRATRCAVEISRTLLTERLQALNYQYYAGPTNFVLVAVGDADRCAVTLQELGVTVATLDQPELRNYVRVTLGDPLEMPAVADAFSLLAASHHPLPIFQEGS